MTQLLVEAAWLAEHRSEVVVVDVRWSPGGGTDEARRLFEEGHIPGAIFLDVDSDLSGEPFVDGPGRHPLPAPEAFARTLVTAGIGDGDRIVAYDDMQGSLAARLWWMLDAWGSEVSLLDGGLQAWDGPLQTGVAAERAVGSVSVRPWPQARLVDANGVTAAQDEGVIVFDARAPERFRGETEPIDPVAGHIPGAVNLPWTGNIDPATGRFLSADVLRERYERALRGRAAIAQCGSGTTACHDIFAMRLAGLPDPVLYEGSWSDWVSDPTRPVATGDEPLPSRS
jgi:thiosulfate/3-mercaptopyruvate sulfurtransferase